MSNATHPSTLTHPYSQFNKGSSILDSGTTDIYLPAVVFNEVKKLFMQNMQVGTVFIYFHCRQDGPA